MSDPQISLRELREWDGGFNSARHREAVLALVEAVEAAQAYLRSDVTAYELRAALVRFKDYA